ncbi:MAG: HDIG domain-containing metalloprotein, partial [Myxococcota bacterium]
MAVSLLTAKRTNIAPTAIVFIVPMALFAGLGAHQPLEYVAYLTAGSLVGANAMGKVTHRMDLLKAGLMVGLVNAVMICSVLLLRGEMEFKVYLVAVAVGFSSGLMSGVLVSALLPLIEWAFDYTTDIKLLELADLNHPALRELIMKAPGSYHHSVIVGNLCKEAAEAIGANPLLARVGAYYHDIGKGKNPQYFAENQRQGNNPHDKLKPNMSALIIKAHVKDGLELARQHNLPREIEDFIAQHHGTNLIAYFYHRAKSLEDPDIPEVDEKDYRYPGPKPQTRETAICLLADGIEAASRAMPDPTPDRLKGLVQKMINKAFADGQLDECELTLKDLNAIAKAFIRVLMGMYHSRPQYPEDKRKRDDKRNKPQPSGAQQRPPRTQSNNSPPKGNARADTPVVRARPTKSTRARRGQAVFEDRLGDNNPEVLALNQPKRTTEFPSQKRGAAANAASKASPSKTEPKASHTTKPLPGHTPRKKDPANRKAAQDAPKTGSAPGDDEELETLNDIGAIIDNRTPSQENNTPPAEDHAAPANGEAEAPYPEAQGDALQDSDEEAELEEEQDDHAAGADRGESGGDDLGDNDQPPPPDEPDAPPLRRLGLS